MQLSELQRVLDAQLEPWRFKDYAPNGLQVEGRAEVRTIVTGVTASQALLDAAIWQQADAILVHHGYFWKNEDPRLVGIKKHRLQTLLAHDISLLAYHLPLDAHLELGNNAQLAKELGWQVEGQSGDQGLLWFGAVPQPQRADDFARAIGTHLGREALLLGSPDKEVRRVAWCTGGAQGYFADAIALGVDVFVTGEVSEQQHHMALEYGVAFVAAGHHATERYGIQALGAWLSNNHEVSVVFADIPNPV
ncbi:NIF3 family protein [Pseudogulbenkiania sp. NH8B]|uniref:Nif3-like dinuclear metal center hexameric protein n=1 Tax=Pseudogulbenkiania sp. (strain NH8B) TaxID=748280 RepID=UPI000227A593|nr:Nif3-like dinuclear metal center hexameric protein [Pseudogulbenkiania sp. NH8B]BAK78285.1 NIF3 family protein [Pseudogulbenkiania sp. NH8B]